MSENNLVVPTAFGDISELSEGFADRVDGERLMLYGPQAIADGEWVQFAVTLADESPALEGTGRAVASIDGGEERPEVARFDIVLDSLQLEGSAQVVYERILMVRNQAFAEMPGTGEVNVEELEAQAVAEVEAPAEEPVAEYYEEPAAVAEPMAEEVASAGDFADMSTEIAQDGYHEDIQAAADVDLHAEPVYDEGPQIAAEPDVTAETNIEYSEAATESFEQENWGDAPDATNEVDVSALEDIGVDAESLPPSAPPPSPPSEPPGFQIQGLGSNGQVLTRPSLGATWEPDFLPAPEPRAASGHFAYAGGLPVPASAPRPDIDSTLRIKPAPRPTEGGEPAQDAGGYEEPVAGYEEAPLEAVEEVGGYEDAELSYEEAPAELEAIEDDAELVYEAPAAEDFDEQPTEVVEDYED